ncbi:MAG: ice-binding family protein, partial [Deltaproteobacteria bacterium]
MMKKISLLQRSAALAVVLPFALYFAAACGSGAGGAATTDGGATDGGAQGGADAGANGGGQDSGVQPGSDGGGDAGEGDAGLAQDAGQDAGDGGVNDPANPSGLGPAAVDLGSTTDLASAAPYVLLAKTGITNVTGSMITGGEVGLSPAAASFITGFSLIADPSNVYATSASVASPGKVYASDYAPPTPSNLTTAVLKMQSAYSDAAGR